MMATANLSDVREVAGRAAMACLVAPPDASDLPRIGALAGRSAAEKDPNAIAQFAVALSHLRHAKYREAARRLADFLSWLLVTILSLRVTGYRTQSGELAVLDRAGQV